MVIWYRLLYSSACFDLWVAAGRDETLVMHEVKSRAWGTSIICCQEYLRMGTSLITSSLIFKFLISSTLVNIGILVLKARQQGSRQLVSWTSEGVGLSLNLCCIIHRSTGNTSHSVPTRMRKGTSMGEALRTWRVWACSTWRPWNSSRRMEQHSSGPSIWPLCQVGQVTAHAGSGYPLKRKVRLYCWNTEEAFMYMAANTAAYKVCDRLVVGDL